MRVAIPIINENIEPTFDFASELLIVSYHNREILEEYKVGVVKNIPSLKAAELKGLKINTLICGVISNPLAAIIWHSNINIITGITGNANVVIKEFLDGKIRSSQNTLPGFLSKRWQGCCGRYRGGRFHGCKGHHEK